MVFLEVPCESPLGLARVLRRLTQVAIMAITRPALAASVARTAGLYMMHEHINYFTEQSLATLLRSCGCGVVASGTYPANGGTGKADMAWCLGRVS